MFPNETLLEDTEISIRTYSVLKRNDLHTVGDVRALSRTQVESLKHIRRKSIEEMEQLYEIEFQ